MSAPIAKTSTEASPKTSGKKSKKSKVEFSQLEVLSGSVQVGDSADQVRRTLGEPYIETTTASGDGLWIYTKSKSISGEPCEVVKWNLVFKGSRLKDWSEPKGDTIAGYCAAQK